MLSDQAPYAIKVGKMLKEIFPNLKHVSCLVHCLHRVCEKLKGMSPYVDKIVAFLKAKLVKNKENQKIFCQLSGKPMPKLPIVTRWGSWLTFVVYIHDNFNSVNQFFIYCAEKLHLPKIKELYNSESVKNELVVAKQHAFFFNVIKKLEREDLNTMDQIAVVKNIQGKILNKKLKTKMANCMEKNPDLDHFMTFNYIKVSDEAKKYGFVPLNAVSVERSFFKLTAILSDKRKCMNIESLKMLLFFYFNKL